MVYTYRETKERIRKEILVLLTGGGEATNPKKMDALYVFVRS